MDISAEIENDLEEFPMLLDHSHIQEILGCSRRSAYRFINNTELADGRQIKVKIGGSVRALKWGVIEWLQEQVQADDGEEAA